MLILKGQYEVLIYKNEKKYSQHKLNVSSFFPFFLNFFRLLLFFLSCFHPFISKHFILPSFIFPSFLPLISLVFLSFYLLCFSFLRSLLYISSFLFSPLFFSLFCFHLISSPFSLFFLSLLFWLTSSNTQGIFLALCSGIIPFSP